jgi:hypothetical protein
MSVSKRIDFEPLFILFFIPATIIMVVIISLSYVLWIEGKTKTGLFVLDNDVIFYSYRTDTREITYELNSYNQGPLTYLCYHKSKYYRCDWLWHYLRGSAPLDPELYPRDKIVIETLVARSIIPQQLSERKGK